MLIDEYLRMNSSFRPIGAEEFKEHAPRVECVDGFSMSVQASQYHYCTPRQDTGPYLEMEIGFPSSEEPLIMPYAEDNERPTKTVYGYVPTELIDEVITKHGGIKTK